MSQIVADPTTISRPVELPPPSGWRALARRAWVSERFWSWAGPLVVTLVGGYQRFWHLGTPHKLIFDETYYVKEGVSYLKYGIELTLKESINANADKRNESADRLFVAGHLDIFSSSPDRVVHPMVGKWMIAFGEWLFGPTSSVGWRFSVALCGTLALLMVGRIAFRLFGSALLATTAALLLAVDGQEFVHSRTGILDMFVMFWALAAFGCLLIDRDRTRVRLRAAVPPAPGRAAPGAGGDRRLGFGPWTGPRWWRVAALVCLGLCTGVKWSGIYFTAAFMLLSVCWDMAARRAVGVRHWLAAGAQRDGAQAFATTVLVYPAVYLATWVTWFATGNGWNRHWAEQNGPAEPGWAWVPDALRSLWHYHAETWAFHVALTSPHDWQANPWAWLVVGRPTLFFFDTHTRGHGGCHVQTCRQMITDLGNPLIWWGATLAVGVLLFRWLLSRDWRAGAVTVGLAAGYLPWFLYQKRTIFEFYAVAFVPWVVLAVTYCLALVLGPPEAPPERRRTGAMVAGSYVFLCVVLFWYLFPILAARTIPQAAVDVRDWLPSWY
ncbi:MAG TPA: phospholipid carrier-dependent glycosyltransferase [Kineosporiaceae bacterium]